MTFACPVCGEDVDYASSEVEETGSAAGWRTLRAGTSTYQPCGHQTASAPIIHGRPKKMAVLGREAILEASDTEYDEVPVPEWQADGVVRLKSITGTQRDAYEGSVVSSNGGNAKVNFRNARTKLIVLCAVDEDGRLLFTADDITALGRKNAAPLDRLFDACQRLAGMTAKDVESLTENFGDARSDEDISA